MLNVPFSIQKVIHPMLTLLEVLRVVVMVMMMMNTHSSASVSLIIRLLDHCTESLRHAACLELCGTGLNASKPSWCDEPSWTASGEAAAATRCEDRLVVHLGSSKSSGSMRVNLLLESSHAMVKRTMVRGFRRIFLRSHHLSCTSPDNTVRAKINQQNNNCLYKAHEHDQYRYFGRIYLIKYPYT